MTRPGAEAILEMFDAGHTPRAIIAAGFDKYHVYRVLRRSRPERARAPRSRTSTKPALFRALGEEGLSAERIAQICQYSLAYVYRHIQ